MSNAIVERILREIQQPELLNVLAERLNPSDLQSLLLEVARLRAARQTPAGLLAQYERSRFTQPSQVDPRRIVELDRLAFSLAAPAFEAIELAPVCPLGAVSALTGVDQNSTIATVRGSEVVSDSTNVLALECALRRRALLQDPGRTRERVKLCASQRLLRGQNFNRPNALAHFRLFALVTAGRDEGSLGFEQEALGEQLGFYLRFLTTLNDHGYALHGLRVALTDFEPGRRDEQLESGVISPLAGQFPQAAFGFDPDRQGGRGYYSGICFHVYARNARGEEYELADGGLTDWTQQLLNNRKERLLISGIGVERLGTLFRVDPG